MARLAASVVVISARTDRGFRGLTATSFVSISTEPPMVLVGLERMTITRNAVIESKAFNVSVLTRSQEFIAERFAGRAPAVAGAWSDVPHHLGANGLPLIASASWPRSTKPAITTSASAMWRRQPKAMGSRSSCGTAPSGAFARKAARPLPSRSDGRPREGSFRVLPPPALPLRWRRARASAYTG